MPLEWGPCSLSPHNRYFRHTQPTSLLWFAKCSRISPFGIVVRCIATRLLRPDECDKETEKASTIQTGLGEVHPTGLEPVTFGSGGGSRSFGPRPPKPIASNELQRHVAILSTCKTARILAYFPPFYNDSVPDSVSLAPRFSRLFFAVTFRKGGRCFQTAWYKIEWKGLVSKRELVVQRRGRLGTGCRPSIIPRTEADGFTRPGTE